MRIECDEFREITGNSAPALPGFDIKSENSQICSIQKLFVSFYNSHSGTSVLSKVIKPQLKTDATYKYVKKANLVTLCKKRDEPPDLAAIKQ